MHRQSSAMTQAAIRSDVDQTLDIHHHFAPQDTFDTVFIDRCTQLGHISLAQGMHASGWIDAGSFYNLIGCRATDTIYISQRYIYSLVPGKINTCYTSHFSSLTLSLLMPRIFANHTQNTFATYHFAVFAAFFY
jgi:hypothetical protein